MISRDHALTPPKGPRDIYLVLRPVQPRYEAACLRSHTNRSVVSVIPGPISIYIPGFQSETNLQLEKLEIEQCEEYIHLVLKLRHSRFLKSHRGCFLLAERIYNRVCKMRSSSNAAAAAAARPIDPDPPAPNSDVKFLSLIKYHWTDWVCLVILIIIEIILEVIHPYKRYVGPKNFVTGELLYPMHSQTIPFYAVPIFSLIIPLVFILTYFFWRKSQRDVHHSILGLLTAVALTAVITDALKDGLGFPRPDFYARCFGSVTAIPVYGPDNNVACTGSPSQIKEGYKSFPSGHASWSFAGLGYLAMYIAGKLGTFFDRRGHTVKLLPVILPLLLATFIAVTRVDNYWHHWFDVFAGGLLGLFVAYFCYRQHYPSLFDVEGSSPYPHMQRHPTLPLAAWPAHSSPSWEGPDSHV